MHYKRIYLTAVLAFVIIKGYALPANSSYRDTMPTSSPQEAIAFLNTIHHLDSSNYWPNVDPAIFLQNLKTFTISPLKFYEGKNTNFCSYAALTWVPLHFDPLGFSRFMITLYREGKAKMGKVGFTPGEAVRNEAGLLKYKGALDINPAGQMWILSLADHFKGYLNVFNRHFNKGDEDTKWASTNFAKFNRMLRRLFYLKLDRRGSDLIHPMVGDRYNYLQKRLKTGTVFVYLNNRLFYKKDHVTVRFAIPTHYVLLIDIYKVGDKVNIVYWDYGLKSLQQVNPKFLRKIIFGITYFSKPAK